VRNSQGVRVKTEGTCRWVCVLLHIVYLIVFIINWRCFAPCKTIKGRKKMVMIIVSLFLHLYLVTFTHTSHTGCILKPTWFQLQELCTSIGQTAVQRILIACPMETSSACWYGSPLDTTQCMCGSSCSLSLDWLPYVEEDWLFYVVYKQLHAALYLN